MICELVTAACISLGGVDASVVQLLPSEEQKDAYVARLWNYNGPLDEINPSVRTLRLNDIEVTVMVTHTFNMRCKPKLCPDKFEVIDLPEGYIAIPNSLYVEEDYMGSILITPYTGF
jgi:hypothetical protein